MASRTAAAPTFNDEAGVRPLTEEPLEKLICQRMKKSQDGRDLDDFFLPRDDLHELLTKEVMLKALLRASYKPQSTHMASNSSFRGQFQYVQMNLRQERSSLRFLFSLKSLKR